MEMGYVTKYTDPKPPFPRMCKISNSEQIVTSLEMRQNDRWQTITEIWIALLENDPSQHGGHCRIAAAKVLVILVYGRVILCRCTAAACAVTKAHRPCAVTAPWSCDRSTRGTRVYRCYIARCTPGMRVWQRQRGRSPQSLPVFI